MRDKLSIVEGGPNNAGEGNISPCLFEQQFARTSERRDAVIPGKSDGAFAVMMQAFDQ